MPNDYTDVGAEAQGDKEPSPTQVPVQPKERNESRKTKVETKDTAPGAFAYREPIAAKVLQQKVRGYLNRKKFLTITLSDVQSEIAELNELEKGFTEFFIFFFFLTTYFWALSIQMNPSLDFQVSKGLQTRMESPRYGNLVDRSFEDVANFDDALSYVEAFFLENYEGTENEHECSMCNMVNELTRQRMGIGAVDLCYRLNISVPSCTHLGHGAFGKCDQCATRLSEIRKAKTDTYTPVTASGDLNTFRDQNADRCAPEIEWASVSAAQHLGGYTSRFAESFGMLETNEDIPSQVAHFSFDRIVDCSSRVFDLITCIKAG